MILEAIVTSLGSDGRVNLAPMGPTVLQESRVGNSDTSSGFDATQECSFLLRPFRSSTTYQNLMANPRATVHVTDDAMVFAQAAVGDLTNEEMLARVNQLADTDWWPMIDCHRWFAVEVVRAQEDELRATLHCRIVESKEVRPFFGFNRARHAVIEAAILATRTHLIPKSQIVDELGRLQPLVDKTGGPQEHAAFDLLKAKIDERYAAK